MSGTGTIAVVHSYTGAAEAGNQANGWFVTEKAAERMNEHEQLHINASEGVYDMFLGPLEARIADPALGQNNSDTAHAAVVIHQSKIKWRDSIKKFMDLDIGKNYKDGVVDSAENASPTYVTHEAGGPFSYLGMFFENLLRRKDEPRPQGFDPIRR